MLCGELTGLRALTDADIEIFETELLADVPTRVRATGRPAAAGTWAPTWSACCATTASRSAGCTGSRSPRWPTTTR